jgi:hypothetical protein
MTPQEKSQAIELFKKPALTSADNKWLWQFIKTGHKETLKALRVEAALGE